MNLFLNAVSSNGKIILFDNNRQIVGEKEVSVLLNESSKLIDIVDMFLSSMNTKIKDIENIVVVHGPGSFTGIRTIVLLVNTLSFIYPKLHLTPLSFFDMYKNYPICKTSSKRDLFVKYSKSAIIEVVKNEELESKYKGKDVYGDISLPKIQCHQDIDYKGIIETLKFRQEKKIETLYIKKPNIS